MSGYRSYSYEAGHLYSWGLADEDDDEDTETWLEGPYSVTSGGPSAPTGFTGHPAEATESHDLQWSTSMEQDNVGMGGDLLWFKMDNAFQKESNLDSIFADVNDRSTAKLARNLQVVTSNHLASLLLEKFEDLDTYVYFPRIGPPRTLIDALTDVIKRLVVISGAINPKQDGEDVEMRSSSPSEADALYSFTFLNAVHCSISDIFLSKLCCSEALYQDWDAFIAFRSHLSTLELHVPIAPEVINAGARVLMINWSSERGLKRLCLDVVASDGIGYDSDQIDHWISCILAFKSRAAVPQPDMIFVPVMIGLHCAVFVINFLDRKLVCMDTIFREERPHWERMEQKILGWLWKLLDKMGDNRKMLLPVFEVQLWHTCWSCSRNDVDCGVTVMHVMESYNPASPVPNIKLSLSEVNARVRKRLYYCAIIVGSCRNIQRSQLIKATITFVDLKSRKLFHPNEEVKKYASKLRSINPGSDSCFYYVKIALNVLNLHAYEPSPSALVLL